MTKSATESVVTFQTPSVQATKRHLRPAKLPQNASAWPSVVIGELTGFEHNQPFVDFPNNPASEPVMALFGTQLSTNDSGRRVILAFVDGNPAQPIILNFLLEAVTGENQPSTIDVQLDGEKLLFTAQKEIVLRCGEASITLTAAGKVLLKGTYLLSRSSGYNKIKGAAVDIN